MPLASPPTGASPSSQMPFPHRPGLQGPQRGAQQHVAAGKAHLQIWHEGAPSPNYCRSVNEALHMHAARGHARTHLPTAGTPCSATGPELRALPFCCAAESAAWMYAAVKGTAEAVPVPFGSRVTVAVMGTPVKAADRHSSLQPPASQRVAHA